MAPPATLVHVDGVSKSYVSAAGSTPVLEGLSLSLERGETTSLVGASGSGKSTLIALLAGLMRPDSGRVVFDGRDTTQLDDTARAELRAGRIGVVMQSGNLIPFLTAMENVELAIEFAGRAASQDRARELLMEVGLGHRLHHLPRRMSGGEAQRVSLAMALANDPDLLLADEATGELDSANAERVMGMIRDAWSERGLTVLLVTHSAELAATAQRRLRLSSGEVQPA
ncbi:MAG TPA: ABC transporter ATP-binding protein [Solirubrobacteraceae bacterium]|jgi:putative ABC transport system ATP-binding protein|nr:ABC transporter ATP-binding protein [Solirubrobacteraceae bacterium]